jgi:Tol biopolymer transport system component
MSMIRPATVKSVAMALALGLFLAAAEAAIAALPGASNGQIAFVSDRDPLGSGNTQVFVMGPGGENPTNVSTNPDNDADPSFSPDGSRIVFAGDPDTGNEDIYVMNADGTNRQRLTASDSEETEPVFSPDGTRIAFVSFSDGSLGSEIHLIDADGGNRVRLLFPPGSDFLSFFDPAWSPDGTRIAFTREGGGDTNIWVIDLATGVQTRLTSGQELKSEPDWSPDGSRIAYVSDPFILGATTLFSNPDIWAMNADGNGNVQLTSHRWADTAPVFSPNGSQIAFTRRRPDTDPQAFFNYPGDIYAMNADGSNQHNLTASGTRGSLEDEEAGDEDPSWQPLGPGADRVDPRFAGTISVPAVLPILSQPTRAVTSASRRRGVIRFRVSERASAKLAVESTRRGRKVKRGRRTRCVPTRKRVSRRNRCTTRKLHGWIVRRAKRGRNRVLFTGRLGRKALKPGRYRIRVGAVDRTANPARQKQSRTFRIVR